MEYDWANIWIMEHLFWHYIGKWSKAKISFIFALALGWYRVHRWIWLSNLKRSQTIAPCKHENDHIAKCCWLWLIRTKFCACSTTEWCDLKKSSHCYVEEQYFRNWKVKVNQHRSYVCFWQGQVLFVKFSGWYVDFLDWTCWGQVLCKI